MVLHESGTWRLKPGQVFTFGRGSSCTLSLASDDRGVSRTAGSLAFAEGLWWLSNDSMSSMLYLTGDRGFRVDLPPGMRAPVQMWHAKVRITGTLDSYTVRLRLPELDEEPDPDLDSGNTQTVASQRVRTSTRNRAPLTESDRLVLAARFEEYLTWRHVGEPAPRSARETAARIGWEPHTVSKRCENIRNRYARHGVAELRGPRALEELAVLLITTGELSAEDLHRLPPIDE